MLKKNHRLRRADITPLFKKGKSTHTKYFSIRSVSVSDWSDVAFGVVIPKKVSKLATDRNNMKRRVYSILRDLLEELSKPKKGIITLKRDIKGVNREELFEDLKHSLT